MANRLDVEKKVSERMSLTIGEDWNKLPHDKREKFIREQANYLYEIVDNAEKDLEKANDQKKEAKLLIFGTVFGIIGGLIATIINSFLEKYEFNYYLTVLLLFLIFALIFLRFIRESISKTFDSDKLLKELLEPAKEKVK